MTDPSDRAEVIHFAGRHHLSPAVRDGTPALVPEGEVQGRCGWAELFGALHERRLTAAFDPADPGSFRAVPQGTVPAPERPRRAWLSDARAFVEALRGRFPPG